MKPPNGTKEPEGPEIRFRTTLPFKLKDRPRQRNYQAIHLVKQFGFTPEVIIIEKVIGKNNAFMVRAILTPEEVEKEKKLKEAELAKEEPKIIVAKK